MWKRYVFLWGKNSHNATNLSLCLFTFFSFYIGYAHKTKLESHQMNVHIRARPYKCRVENCDADFNELANRNAHEKNVHQYNYKKTMELANSSMTVLDDVKIIIAKDSEDITIKNLKHSEEA